MPAKETIRAYYDAFNRQDMEAFFDLLHDDVIHDINQGGRQVGKDAFRTFMAHMNRSYRETLTDIVIMSSEDGRRGAAEFVVNGQYLATDEGLRRPTARPMCCRPAPSSKSAMARSPAFRTLTISTTGSLRSEPEPFPPSHPRYRGCA